MKKLWLLIAFVMLGGLLFTGCGKQNESEVETENSLKEKFSNAEIRTDIEPVANRITWLTVKECQWKAVSFESSVPGPTDILVCGYITTDDRFFEEASAAYEWYCPHFSINMIPEGIKEESLNFMVSEEYREMYEEKQNGSKVGIYVDFDNRLVYFSGTFSGIKDNQDVKQLQEP